MRTGLLFSIPTGISTSVATSMWACLGSPVKSCTQSFLYRDQSSHPIFTDAESHGSLYSPVGNPSHKVHNLSTPDLKLNAIQEVWHILFLLKIFPRVLFLKFCTKTWQKVKIPKRKLSKVILIEGFFSLVTILVIDESRRPLLQLFESTQLNFFFMQRLHHCCNLP